MSQTNVGAAPRSPIFFLSELSQSLLVSLLKNTRKNTHVLTKEEEEQRGFALKQSSLVNTWATLFLLSPHGLNLFINSKQQIYIHTV
jgi:hypothetical protein